MRDMNIMVSHYYSIKFSTMLILNLLKGLLDQVRFRSIQLGFISSWLDLVWVCQVRISVTLTHVYRWSFKSLQCWVGLGHFRFESESNYLVSLSCVRSGMDWLDHSVRVIFSISSQFAIFLSVLQVQICSSSTLQQQCYLYM